MNSRLIWCEQARVNLLLNVRVILRELVKLALSHQVRAAVTHLAYQVTLRQQHQDGRRGAHASLVLLRQGAFENGIVGRADSRSHALTGFFVGEATQRADLLRSDA